MNKESEELACLYVLDQLDGRERSRFEERLLREPDLADFVRDLDPVLARSIDSLPRRDPPAGTLSRIEARLDWLHVNERAAGAREPASRSLNWLSFLRWGIASVIAVSLSVIAVQMLRTTGPAQPVVVFVGMDANRSTIAEVPLKPNGADSDARFMQLATLAEDFWQKPADRPVAPSSAGNRAYALFDPGTRQGFIVVEQLPAPGEGQQYHLWAVDPASGRVRDAGGLPLDSVDNGFYSFGLGSDDSLMSDRPNFFITLEEGATGSTPTQPRGKVVLGRGML